MRVKIIFFLLFLTGLAFKAQQPAYFILGENQFKGLQIYDVIQDKNLNYWFATNDGLFYFNHYSYHKVKCDKSKSYSVFNFVMDDEGIIYCNNLNHQVFQIKNKICKLFYELKEDEISSDISLSIVNTNQILIGAKKVIQLSAEGKIVNRINVSGHYLGQAFTYNKKAIYYHLGSGDSILQIDKNGVSKHQLKLPAGQFLKQGVLKFFQLKGKVYAFNLKSKEIYSFKPENDSLAISKANPLFNGIENVRFYSAGNEIWAAGTLPGVVMFKDSLPVKIPQPFYNNYFISDVYKDIEGNILLSTFDRGVLVIPDMQTPDVIQSFKEDPITSITTDAKFGLLMGSSKGLLLNYKDGILDVIDNKGKRPIEGIYTSDQTPLIIFDNGYISVLDKNSKATNGIYEASLKDAVIVSKDLIYLGTNRGVFKCKWNGKKSFTIETVKNLLFRIYSLTYNETSQNLYISSSAGLFVMQANGTLNKIFYNNEAVFPNSLYHHKGLVYAADKNGGVLVIDGNTVKKIIPLTLNGEPEVFNKIIVNNNYIIAESLKGLFLYNLKGELLNPLSSSYGFAENRVMDFAIRDSLLWVSHTGGVQQINLKTLRVKDGKPGIFIANVFVNDSVESSKINTFSSTQRKIQFVLSTPTLRNRESIKYHYKLEGNDNHWSENDYFSNQVTYNALAPGSYTFYVRAEKLGQSSQLISYSFTIQSPFYTRWWFITLIVFVFLGTVYCIYRWQLRLQRIKSERINELNASRLTAIQSQMNPHFIFNALNSIQGLILKGDVEHSYSYITTFSDLVRRTLSYSGKDFIDFEQEIKLLQLYLSLEKLRFKKDFDYTINTNDLGDIQIPPMLIQPFIENALVHGLFHKEGNKTLSIRFELNDKLKCIIEDNGVGRRKAAEIKERQKHGYESFSGKAIKRRLEILSNVFEGNFSYTYEDLFDENNQPAGTRLILLIPFVHRF